MINHNPKVFISYCWKNKAYQNKVLLLAKRLRGNGVDVVLDQWDLRPGQDMNAFMEMSIRDAEKVLILCESQYTERANCRKGGVGKETAIITPEVYGQYRQEKFIPVVMENPASFPAYLKSTMAVFYTTGSDDEYINLLRAIYNIHKEKPELGLIPDLDWFKGKTLELDKDFDCSTTKGKVEKPELGQIPVWVRHEGNKNIAFATVSNLNLHIGDRNIAFGKFPQSESGREEPLLWRVLDIDEEKKKALMITEKLIISHRYHNKNRKITWEKCDLRKWLNEEFYNLAFSLKESERIIPTEINNSANKYYGTDGGNSTKDKVFILSLEEAEKYFKSDSDKITGATKLLIKQGVYLYDKGMGWWWLRSPGRYSNCAACVDPSGGVIVIGYYVHNDGIGVRPAIWLNL